MFACSSIPHKVLSYLSPHVNTLNCNLNKYVYSLARKVDSITRSILLIKKGDPISRLTKFQKALAEPFYFVAFEVTLIINTVLGKNLFDKGLPEKPRYYLTKAFLLTLKDIVQLTALNPLTTVVKEIKYLYGVLISPKEDHLIPLLCDRVTAVTRRKIPDRIRVWIDQVIPSSMDIYTKVITSLQSRELD